MKPLEAYDLLASITSYVINAFFGTLLGLGILILRLKGPPRTRSLDDDDTTGMATRTWKEMTGNRINPLISIISATIFMLGSLYPVVNRWVPSLPTYSDDTEDNPLPWWWTPTVSWCIIAFSALWFVAFVLWAWHQKRKNHRAFIVEKRPEFEPAEKGQGRSTDGEGRGGLVLVHETVFLSWVGRETLMQRDTTSEDFSGMDMRVEDMAGPMGGGRYDTGATMAQGMRGVASGPGMEMRPHMSDGMGVGLEGPTRRVAPPGGVRGMGLGPGTASRVGGMTHGGGDRGQTRQLGSIDTTGYLGSMTSMGPAGSEPRLYR